MLAATAHAQRGSDCWLRAAGKELGVAVCVPVHRWASGLGRWVLFVVRLWAATVLMGGCRAAL